MRIGIGYDSHRLVAGRPLRLGGVTIPFTKGLAGHSDADALLHAIGDALLGAVALGDIGQMFPDDDPQWKDADSGALLGRIVERIAEHGYRVRNIDATIVAEQPRLAPYLAPMRERVATLTRIPVEVASLKAKTNEHLGWIGRGEGIACLAVALLESVAP